MDYFIESLGVVRDGDIVALAPGLQVRDRILFDHVNGARHVIPAKVRDALKVFGSGIEISQWHSYAIASPMTDKEWMGIIEFLNTIGGLGIRRTPSAHIQLVIRRIQWRFQGVPIQSRAIRTIASVKGLAYAISQAIGQLVILTIIISMLSIFVGIPEYAFLALTSITILWITTFVHEYTHVVLCKASNRLPAVIVRGLRLGILHHQLSRKRNILSALMGPLMGIISAAFFGLAGRVIRVNVFIQASLLVSIFHALSWMPSYGDGRVLLKELTIFK